VHSEGAGHLLPKVSRADGVHAGCARVAGSAAARRAREAVAASLLLEAAELGHEGTKLVEIQRAVSVGVVAVQQRNRLRGVSHQAQRRERRTQLRPNASKGKGGRGKPTKRAKGS
jgi:hypothetical protein